MIGYEKSYIKSITKTEVNIYPDALLTLTVGLLGVTRGCSFGLGLVVVLCNDDGNELTCCSLLLTKIPNKVEQAMLLEAVK